MALVYHRGRDRAPMKRIPVSQQLSLMLIIIRKAECLAQIFLPDR